MKTILVLFIIMCWVSCGHFITKPSIIHATNKKWTIGDEVFADVGGPIVLVLWEIVSSPSICLDNCEKGR